MIEPNIDYKETTFDNFEEIRTYASKSVGNIRYSRRADAVNLATYHDKFASLELNGLWIIGGAIAIAEAVYLNNYLILISIIISVLITIYARFFKWGLVLALAIIGILIPNVAVTWICINLPIMKLLYELWYFHVRKSANKAILSNPDLFERMWNSTGIAIARGGEVYFHSSTSPDPMKSVVEPLSFNVNEMEKSTSTESTNYGNTSNGLADEENSLMYCNKCGAPLINNASFCNKCGTKLPGSMPALGSTSDNVIDIEKYLRDLVKRDYDKEVEDYIKMMMDNDQSKCLTYNQVYVFLGVVAENHYKGKAKALDAYDKLIKQWIETIENSDEPCKSKVFWTLMFSESYLSGALAANNVVTNAESDALSEKYGEMIRKYVDKALLDESKSQTKKKNSGPDEAAMDQIRKWKSLFDEGILTKEEFEQKKKEILGL